MPRHRNPQWPGSCSRRQGKDRRSSPSAPQARPMGIEPGTLLERKGRQRNKAKDRENAGVLQRCGGGCTSGLLRLLLLRRLKREILRGRGGSGDDTLLEATLASEDKAPRKGKEHSQNSPTRSPGKKELGNTAGQEMSCRTKKGTGELVKNLSPRGQRLLQSHGRQGDLQGGRAQSSDACQDARSAREGQRSRAAVPDRPFLGQRSETGEEIIWKGLVN